MNKLPFQIAMLIFILIGIGHLLRMALHVEVMVGQHHVPMSLSVIADVIAFAMAWWIWRSLK